MSLGKFLSLLGGGLLALSGCSGATAPSTSSAEAALSCEHGHDDAAWWRNERARRQQAFDDYLTANADDWKSFKNAALGSSGIPLIMFRLLPDLFPQLFGGPNDHFAPVGFGEDPFEPGRFLPLGFGFTGSSPAVPTPVGPVHVQVVALSCIGCHGGRVTGSDGKVQTLPGAPSTQFNQFRLAVSRMVNSPAYTADAFRATLATKPAGWLYGNDPAYAQQEAIERAIFNAPGGAEQFLGNLKAGSNAGAARFAATLGAHTYAVANAPDLYASKPGYLDAIGAGISIVVDPTKLTFAEVGAVLPPAPAEIDIMSVWNAEGRPAAQWDGSIQSQVHRNLAAEFGVIGDPSKLNLDNAVRTTRFTQAFPSVPYPFDVDQHAARRGQKLYDEYCASCHAPGSSTIFPTSVVGTDANRANIWTPYTLAALAGVLKASCTDASCKNPDGSPLADSQIVRATGGYMAVPLDGIWARAPYLHNGSVPTLYALLTGDRPTTFYRGNTAYDEDRVGFVWDVAAPGAAVYDTTRSGTSNVGHDGEAFNGLDWKKHPKKLNDLLEYMKTL